MQTDKPTDLKPLVEISRDLRIPYQTLRSWQITGKIAEYQEGSAYRPVYMASIAEVRSYAERPRRKLPKEE